MSSDRSINVRTLLCGKEGLSLSLPLGLPTWEQESGGAEMPLVYENLMKIIFPAVRIRGDWKDPLGGNWYQKMQTPWTFFVVRFFGEKQKHTYNLRHEDPQLMKITSSTASRAEGGMKSDRSNQCLYNTAVAELQSPFSASRPRDHTKFIWHRQAYWRSQTLESQSVAK